MYSSREVVDPDMKNGNQSVEIWNQILCRYYFLNKLQKCVQLTHLPYVGLK